jgi:hypothetical protein
MYLGDQVNSVSKAYRTRAIDYGGQLPGTIDEAKKEFLAGVSSLGNTVDAI